MSYEKLMAIATSFIAFSTSLGVLIALIYYSYQIKKISILEGIIISIFYIDVNLLFLYLLKKRELI